ncbi:class I SAM-dependent methyltransferase [Brevundimonas goettingensis]|nr:SAM-dependent methyltransferase [Brevundimonas goettingensis]
MSLKASLTREITLTGPMTVADYVTRCLHDPVGGYYSTRPALGEGGDFITAPLISQMFGELLGLWAAETWHRLGAPERVRLVEVGPGDGTLMDDALRALRLAPDFLQACDLILIEPSAPLRQEQERRLAGADISPRWLSSLNQIETDAPVILIANEVLDCMPARQFVKTDDGWSERRVGVSDDGDDILFGLSTITGGFEKPNYDVEPGQIVEISDQQAIFGRDLAVLMAEASGAALLIDYGRDKPGPGDTLQALHRHARVDPLEHPGAADLTMWADFPRVLEAAVRAGADVTGCKGQGEFLRLLGIEARADRLIQGRPSAEAVIRRQLDRLTADDQMGTLFKVASIFSPRSLTVPGFE